MIDFRYHLVSLVSVFLALAVGIVLGAGPLKESLGTRLYDEVTSLRQDRDSLNEELRTARVAADHRDSFISAITPTLVAQQLGGRSVALVLLPGTNDDGHALGDALTAAGASVSVRLRVLDHWADADGAKDRVTAINRLAAAVPGLQLTPMPTRTATTTTSDDDGGDAGVRQLSRALSWALATSEIARAGRPDPLATTVLRELRAENLVSLDGAFAGRGTEVLVIAPALPTALVSGGSTSAGPTTSRPGARRSGRATTTTTTQADDSAARLAAWLDLIAVMDTAESGTVVLGPASAASDGGLVSAVRSDSVLSHRVTTIDTGETPMGPVSAVLALREQLAGVARAYGFARGAHAALPSLNAVTP